MTNPDRTSRESAVGHGHPASPGRAAGPVLVMPPGVREPAPGPSSVPGDEAAERIAAVSDAVRDDLRARADRAEGEAREVLEITALMAADPSMTRAAQQLARESDVSPERAVWDAAQTRAEHLRGMGGYLAERARDVLDVRDRMVSRLLGRPDPGVPEPGHPFVLVAEDLAPADTATLNPDQVVAIVTRAGGPTSHTAILARSLGIPAVVGMGPEPVLSDGVPVLVDGAQGSVTLYPSEQAVAQARALATRVRHFDGDGRTSDGHRVALLANVGSAADAEAAAAAGAQGIGLFRTELCFLDRRDRPGVTEQVETYRRVLAAFPGQRVVARTLDAGADKPMPFLSSADEPNPALGVRGIRATTRQPEVLEEQLDALAQAAEAERAEVWVMAPMVATAAEAEHFVERCRAHGLPQAGVMVEVPAAALRAEGILAHADFASIGTNDLTQYVMAADRMLGELGELSSGWQPAVLDLVAATCAGGAAAGKPVGVCGEAAADPALAVVLVGLGVSSLSMSPRALADVAAVLGAVSLEQCRALAARARRAESADDARAAVRAQLPVLDDLAL